MVAVNDVENLVRTLPLVSSADLHRNPGAYVSDEATNMNSYWTTTGETGRNPTSVRLSNASFGIEWKHMHFIWNSAGCPYDRTKDLKLTFRGYHFKPGEIIRFDPIYNEISVDPFQLTNETFQQFYGAIARRSISYIHGYPSLIKLFMERLADMGLPFHVKLIMLASEGASKELKDQMAAFFGGRVITWYGLTEKVVLAYDSNVTGRYVNFTSYGYPWVFNPDENGVGEIVGTTFVNKAMPLVNYLTGDYGRVVKENGRMYIEQVQGRTGKDYIYDDVGNKYPATGVNLPAKIQEKIVFNQVIQDFPGAIRVTFLPRSSYLGEQDEIARQIKLHILDLLPQFSVSVMAVKSEGEFLRSKRGKFIMLVQNVHNMNNLTGGGVNSSIYRSASLEGKEADYVVAA